MTVVVMESNKRGQKFRKIISATHTAGQVFVNISCLVVSELRNPAKEATLIAAMESDKPLANEAEMSPLVLFIILPF